MKGPIIRENQVETLLDKRFIRVFDLQYAEGKHYFDATRRTAEDLVAIKTEEEFKNMAPDAVTCIVILDGEEPKLLLSYEYRYPAGRFLLSPPAGLIDAGEDLHRTGARELHEEAGIHVKENDRVFTISPFLFSTPGMTDESNALVGIVIAPENTDAACRELSQAGAEGTELFDGFRMVNREEAEKLFADGRDENGHYYSVYTWCALMYFVSGMWKN